MALLAFYGYIPYISIFMTIIIPIPAIVAGLLASFLYYALAQAWIVGITAPFLPIFILAVVGMSYGRAGITVATVACIPTLLLLLPFYDAVLLITTKIIPLLLFVRFIMVVIISSNPPSFVWSSVGTALSMLALYGAGFYSFIIATDSSLYQYLSNTMLEEVKKGFTTLDPEMAATLEGMMTQIPHVLLAVDFWLWSLILFIVVSLANNAVTAFDYGRRPHLKLTPHTPPNLLLGLLGVAGIVGVVGSESLVHAGQAASIILLIPYFFSGLSFVHRRLRALPNGSFWVGAFYILFLLFNLWPLLFVTLFGLVRHLGQYTFTSSTSRK